MLGWRDKVIKHKTAIFRQINKEKVAAHHDALEFPDGQIVLLTCVREDQAATVLLRSGTQQDGHYRVRIHGQWFVVPDNAVVTEPNRFGPAVVWPYDDRYGNTQIRCFIPGAGT
jgi:hypothetical protein